MICATSGWGSLIAIERVSKVHVISGMTPRCLRGRLPGFQNDLRSKADPWWIYRVMEKHPFVISELGIMCYCSKTQNILTDRWSTTIPLYRWNTSCSGRGSPSVTQLAGGALHNFFFFCNVRTWIGSFLKNWSIIDAQYYVSQRCTV